MLPGLAGQSWLQAVWAEIRALLGGETSGSVENSPLSRGSLTLGNRHSLPSVTAGGVPGVFKKAGGWAEAVLRWGGELRASPMGSATLCLGANQYPPPCPVQAVAPDLATPGLHTVRVRGQAFLCTSASHPFVQGPFQGPGLLLKSGLGGQSRSPTQRQADSSQLSQHVDGDSPQGRDWFQTREVSGGETGSGRKRR